MRRGRFISRRNAHETVDFEPEFVPTLRDECVCRIRKNARLLRLCAGIDLNEQFHFTILPTYFIAQCARDFRPVDGLNDVKKPDRLTRLVRLERADKPQFDIGMVRPQRRPFRLRLLDAVFPENALACGERLAKFRLPLRFRDRNHLDRFRAPCFPERRSEAALDGRKVCGEIGGEEMIGVSVHDGLRGRAAKLAAAAAALKRRSGVEAAPFSLAFLTDRRRIASPEPILRALPTGAAVIYRDYDDPKRTAVAARYAAICRRRGVFFLVGADASLADAISADGLHLPARALMTAAPRRRPGLLTASCHNADELAHAARAGADLALLSPAFTTLSHPYTKNIGPARFISLATTATLPILALGGVNETNAHRLRGPNVVGLAAISAFVG